MIDGRRVLLLLALIVGVLGMHALVLVPGTGADARMSPPAAMVHSAVHAGPDHGPAPATPATPVASTTVDLPGGGAGHGPMPSAVQHGLHLCLAVMAALLVLGVTALVLSRTARPDRPDAPIGALVRRAPRRRPPPTSVRLAQLCVLRN